jgi:outer membrane protein assembly complex protein YaeT
VAWAVGFACLLAAPAGTARAEDWEGKPLTGIRFEPPEQPLPETELAAILNLPVSQPLDRIGLRSALRRLFGTGRYQDLDAFAEPDGEGIRLVIRTQLAFFVGRVTVVGVSDPPNQGQLVNATKLQLGGLFLDEDVQVAVENLRQKLERNGFLRPVISPRLSFDDARQKVDLDFRVEAGPRARYTQPDISGVTPAEAGSLTRTSRWTRFLGNFGWKQVTETRTSRGLERMRRFYAERERLLSKVELADMEEDRARNVVRPVVRVNPGPPVELRVEGAKISKGLLRKLVPVYQEQSVDRDLLVEGMRNLTEHFQSQGYFRASATFESAVDPSGRQAITYKMDLGLAYKLVSLDIEGNSYFDDETIRERMAVSPATRIRYRNGRFSQPLLESDMAAIRDLYVSNGFREVDIRPIVKSVSGGPERLLTLTLEINEGPQWIVEEFELEGAGERHRNRVMNLIASQAGEVFSEANIATDRDQILNYYYNRGYPDAVLDWSLEAGDEPARVKVKFTISEGQPRFVRDIIVGGLRTSNPGMVLERISLQPEAPLSQSELIESQRRLYDLGVFARVDVALQNPEGSERNKFVLFELEEARKYSVNFGLGAEIARIGGGSNFDAPAGTPGFSPRVSFGVSRSNFLGVGHTVAIQTRLSNIQQRTLLTYLAPQFKGVEGLTLTVTGFNDLSRDIRTFSSRRQEGAVQLSKTLSRANTVQTRFAYRRNTVDPNSLNIDPELIPVFSLPVRVGILSGTFIQDRRDDPIESTRGFYNSVDLGLASGYFGSETRYSRILARNTSYHRVFGSRELVLARSTNIGWLYNQNRFGEEDPAARIPIPLPERFFSGGSSTHRGFPENQAGPRDLRTGFPIGGGALLTNNVELRFPLLGDNIGGVAFHDMGNVYSSLDKLSFRQTQRDIADFEYMVHAVGFGVRYRTPIGPVRLDLAYVPNSPRFFGFRGTREELLSGGGSFVVQRISRFQFHFSLGQTF